ncbi:MAG: hypothetical protein L0Y58_23305 [Verrucomicrobia subdivision 3 bacterium]|nr:hypothetical protein [Limisphaerales bacterium]
MNACRKFRKRIALSRADESNDATLVGHLTECAACRAYAAEISALCDAHKTRAAALPEIDAPARLRQKVASAINEASSTPWLYASLRKALAGAAAAALALLIFTFWNKQQQAPTPVEPASSVLTDNTTEIKPSYAAYRNAFSADELEMALDRYSSAGADDEIYRVGTAFLNSQ